MAATMRRESCERNSQIVSIMLPSDHDDYDDDDHDDDDDDDDHDNDDDDDGEGDRDDDERFLPEAGVRLQVPARGWVHIASE